MKHKGRSASTAQGRNGACVNTWEQGCSVVHGSIWQGVRGCSKNQGMWVQKGHMGARAQRQVKRQARGKQEGGEKKEGKPVSLHV